MNKRITNNEPREKKTEGQNSPTIVFILGPTSSGKTRVAVELAKRLDGEIISCDSMQIYKGMDIITQAPPKKSIEEIPHHLISIISPEKEYNASKFAEDAKRAIASIHKKNKVPIFCGGTGLYVKALVDGIFEAPEKDETLRERLEKDAREKGNEHLHNKLKKIDPETAKKLHPNDLRRIIRALEIYSSTGKTMSRIKDDTQGIENDYNCVMFGLSLPREVLYRNISRDNILPEALREELISLPTKLSSY